MPELPEVEALALDLSRRSTGRAITAVHLAQFSALKTFSPPLTSLEGAFIEAVRRHGKFLDISAGGLHLVAHLARAGWVHWRSPAPAMPPKPSSKSPVAARVLLETPGSSGTGVSSPDPSDFNPSKSIQPEAFDFTEAGTKKSLALWVVHDPLEVPGIASLGPDPLEENFTVEVLAAILAAEGRKQIKGVLRHQGTIAGIGNAYSDEILWEARLSPFKPADQIDPAELFEAIRATLTGAVEHSRGLAASDLKREKKSSLAVHGRTGAPCPRCGDTVREVSFADSSLQYCPTCQTGGKPLADRRLSKLLK